MGIQIPPDAPYSVQKALRELDEKIDYLVSTIARGVTPSDLSQVYNTLAQRIEETYRKPTTLDFNDVFRGGGAHALGYVPDPGLGPPDGEHVLTSTGAWGPVLNGYVRVATPGGGGRSLAQAVVEVHGSLAVLSALSACSVRTRTLDVFGNADIKGTLTVSGALDVFGNANIKGALTIGDVYFSLAIDNGNPILSFDNDDYMAYIRVSGTWWWVIGAVTRMWMDSTQFWVAGDCSALTFTDRTPYPANKVEAYSAIDSVEGDGSGNLKHDTLHPFVKSISVKDGKTVNSRNLSATVSVLAEVVKDLITRIDALEKKP